MKQTSPLEMSGTLKRDIFEPSPISIGVKWAAAIWPLEKTIVMLPAGNAQTVNLIYLTETLTEIKSKLGKKALLMEIAPWKWTIYVCHFRSNAKVNLKTGEIENHPTNKIRNEHIRKYLEAKMAAQSEPKF